jgi:2-hydroxymuconate-semialdehyde hydrolase
MEPDILSVPVGPGALNVERYGMGGNAIVLIHGFATGTFLWRNIAPELARAGWTVFAIDLMGYGESDRPIDAHFGIAAQAEFVATALTSLRIAKATLVGQDIGGNVALAVATKLPDRIERLVLINTLLGTDLQTNEIRTMQRSTARHALRLSRGVMGAKPLLAPLLESLVTSPERMPARLVARYLATYVGPDGARHLLNLARSLKEDEIPDIDTGRVAIPVLIVWGDADLAIDSVAADRLLSAFPNSRLARMQGVGRLVPEDAPAELAETIAEFIGAGTPAARKTY